MGLIDLFKKWYTEFIAKQRERNQARQLLNSQIEEVVREERTIQAIQTAKFKEENKWIKQREFIKNGGAIGALSKGLNNLTTNINTKKPNPSNKKNKSKSIGGFNKNVMEDINNFKLFN